jgi:hypothetical protein
MRDNPVKACLRLMPRTGALDGRPKECCNRNNK